MRILGTKELIEELNKNPPEKGKIIKIWQEQIPFCSKCEPIIRFKIDWSTIDEIQENPDYIQNTATNIPIPIYILFNGIGRFPETLVLGWRWTGTGTKKDLAILRQI